MKRSILLAILLLTTIIITGSIGAERPKAVPKVASYWEKVWGGVVQCGLCPRRCVINPGQRGACAVRENRDGMLYTLGYGNPVAVHVDPIEKKPFFHVLPGTKAFSIAVAGCNMRCLFCQNWTISQAKPDEVAAYDMPPETVVDAAIKAKCPFIVYTYTEPTVFYEYMLDISKLARSRGLKNGMHTCGYINPEPLAQLLEYMDAVNVDLKSFDESFYKKMGAFAELKPVLETMKAVKAKGVWLEITNLIIPALNDNPEQIRRMCEWIKNNLGDDVPLHFSRFTPAFRLQNLPATPPEKLDEAYRIAKAAGLKYVYVGNIPGNPNENTYCPRCGNMLVNRIGYEVVENDIAGSKCKFCGEKIAGIWTP